MCSSDLGRRLRAQAPAPIEIPLPEPATVDLTLSPPVNAKDKPSTATVAAAALPVQAPSLIDIPLPEPVAVDLTFSPAPAGAPIPATPEADVGPKTEATPPKRPETDARAGSASGRDNDPITVAALADEAPAGTVELPVTNIPLPTPKGVASPAAAHRAIRSAAAKAKPRRKAVAKRDDFDSFFHFGGGKAQ